MKNYPFLTLVVVLLGLGLGVPALTAWVYPFVRDNDLFPYVIAGLLGLCVVGAWQVDRSNRRDKQ